MYKIYAKSKDGLLVDKIYSTFFEDYQKGDILVKEGMSIDCIHVQYNVYDENMCHNYKIKNEKMVETSLEDKRKELDNREYEPNEIEAIQAKIFILEEENKSLKEELIQIQTSIASLTLLIPAALEEK